MKTRFNHLPLLCLALAAVLIGVAPVEDSAAVYRTVEGGAGL